MLEYFAFIHANIWAKTEPQPQLVLPTNLQHKSGNIGWHQHGVGARQYDMKNVISQFFLFQILFSILFNTRKQNYLI